MTTTKQTIVDFCNLIRSADIPQSLLDEGTLCQEDSAALIVTKLLKYSETFAQVLKLSFPEVQVVLVGSCYYAKFDQYYFDIEGVTTL